MPKPSSISTLERFCEYWEKITGLHICIYDYAYFSIESDWLELPYVRCTHCSEYCMLVKSNEEAFHECIKTESQRTALAAKSKKPLLHRCHAGVLDLVVPIIVGSQTAGAVFIGQCAPSDKRERNKYIKSIAKKYTLDTAQLEKAMEGLMDTEKAGLMESKDVAYFVAEYIRRIMGSAIHMSIVDAAVVFNAAGEVDVARIPNYFLDQIAASSRKIKHALERIRNGYWTDIPQATLAKEAGLSESHFSRLFKKQTGMTYRRCLVEARLSAAVWLMKKTDLNNKQIAELLNYGEASSLHRAIRIHTGTTPTDLRRRQPMPWYMSKQNWLPELGEPGPDDGHGHEL
ncbi:MAG: PocR ligand-binding domain-containing protein [Verrucomicrobiota bacterium JB024]|nr:PocR ligand-binding domain-containing protein [Verrucomicrobiota bacterium JB024]